MRTRLGSSGLFVVALLAFTATARSAAAQADPPPAPVDTAPPSPPADPVPPPASTTPAAAGATTATAPAEVRAVPAAQGPLRIEAPNGSSIKFGLLAQPQYQALGNTTLDGMSQNLYVRRLRILVGGSLFGVIEYFVDTDFANLFFANNVAGAMGMPNRSEKNTPGMNIQDAFVTWKAIGDMLKVDVGYMLPPLAHNAVQGATTLYGWDYFAYSFQHSSGANAMAFVSSGNPVGRDAGVQLRGLLLGGMLEYRAGLYQGLRNAQTATEVGSRNFFRATGRLQVNLLDPETGFFYAGSYLGTKKILSFGVSGDFQDNYRYFAGDVIADLPLGAGVFTAQVNLAHWNGGTWIPTLVDQTALMGEAGYLLGAIHLSPVVRLEHLWGSGMVPDQTRYGLGLAFWPYGHNSNLKAFYTRLQQDGAPQGANQFNLQWQVYFF